VQEFLPADAPSGETARALRADELAEAPATAWS